MPTAFGLAGDDGFAAKVGVIFKVCGAGEVFSHVNNGTTTMDHGSRVILANTDHLEVTLEAEEREKSKDELAKKARL